MLPGLKSAQVEENDRHIEEAQKRLEEINMKIRQQQERQERLMPSPFSKEKQWDWTKSYRGWEDWTDLDELHRQKSMEESKVESLIDKKDALGHVHDHSKEREFFQMKEEDKFKVCESYRKMGNYLFAEGSFDRAAELFRVAIGYYEYCFPDESERQTELDSLRFASLCNLALCYLKLRLPRKAIEVATTVISETGDTYPKAYYRLGQAYRLLDDYENALENLEKAREIISETSAIEEVDREIKVVKKLMSGNRNLATKFAESVLKIRDTTINNSADFQANGLEKNCFDINKPLEPLFPSIMQSIIALQYEN